MAATGNCPAPLITRSLRCDTNLSAKAHYLVNFDTSDEQIVNLATDATLPIFVIDDAQDGSSAEANATVIFLGGAWVKLGGTVAQGDPITATTGGVGVESTTDGDWIVGYALEAGVSGDEIPVMVCPCKASVPA